MTVCVGIFTNPYNGNSTSIKEMYGNFFVVVVAQI